MVTPIRATRKEHWGGGDRAEVEPGRAVFEQVPSRCRAWAVPRKGAAPLAGNVVRPAAQRFLHRWKSAVNPLCTHCAGPDGTRSADISRLCGHTEGRGEHVARGEDAVTGGGPAPAAGSRGRRARLVSARHRNRKEQRRRAERESARDRTRRAPGRRSADHPWPSKWPACVGTWRRTDPSPAVRRAERAVLRTRTSSAPRQFTAAPLRRRGHVAPAPLGRPRSDTCAPLRRQG